MQPVGQRVSARPCDLYMFERLLWHGPLPTDHLFHFDGECGRKHKDMLQRRLRLLSEEPDTPHGGRYLDRPRIQFPNLAGGYIPPNHHLVYALHDGAIAVLKENNRYHDGYTRGGWYEHQLMQSVVTAEIEIGTYAHRDYTFIPRHRLHKETHAYPVTIHEVGRYGTNQLKLMLHPDDHFAIDYAGKFRHYFLEVDRGTEVRVGVSNARKTMERSLRQYREFIGGGLYKDMLKTDKGAFVLFVFVNEQQMRNALEILLKLTEGKGNNYMLFRTDTRFLGKTYPAPMVSLDNWDCEWFRAGRPSVYINVP